MCGSGSGSGSGSGDSSIRSVQPPAASDGRGVSSMRSHISNLFNLLMGGVKTSARTFQALLTFDGRGDSGTRAFQTFSTFGWWGKTSTRAFHNSLTFDGRGDASTCAFQALHI